MILSFNIYISHKREFLVSSVGSKKLKLLELLEWYFYNVSLFFFFFRHKFGAPKRNRALLPGLS